MGSGSPMSHAANPYLIFPECLPRRVDIFLLLMISPIENRTNPQTPMTAVLGRAMSLPSGLPGL